MAKTETQLTEEKKAEVDFEAAKNKIIAQTQKILDGKQLQGISLRMRYSSKGDLKITWNEVQQKG